MANGLTDYWQSIRLISAGVPRETADFFFSRKESRKGWRMTSTEPEYMDIPCWSIVALWGLLHARKAIYEFSTDLSLDGLVEALVNALTNEHGREEKQDS